MVAHWQRFRINIRCQCMAFAEAAFASERFGGEDLCLALEDWMRLMTPLPSSPAWSTQVLTEWFKLVAFDDTLE